LKELEEADREEAGVEQEKSGEEIRKIAKGLEERKEQYQEYAKELEQSGESQKLPTDPDSRLMLANDKNHLTPMAVTAEANMEAEGVSAGDGGIGYRWPNRRLARPIMSRGCR
jgi:DNA gyrase/topoisomerase IV subunit A